VKLALLRPDTLADKKPILELAELLERAQPDSNGYPWFLLARGIALYRAERYDESARWLEKMRALPNPPELSATMAGLFLAMGRVKQHRPEDAKKLLAETEAELAKADAKPPESVWINRVQCHAVLPEVQKAVAEAGKK
jgi:hypothetical protein